MYSHLVKISTVAMALTELQQFKAVKSPSTIYFEIIHTVDQESNFLWMIFNFSTALPFVSTAKSFQFAVLFTSHHYSNGGCLLPQKGMVRMQGKPQYPNDTSKSKFKQRHHILLYLLYNTVILIYFFFFIRKEICKT